MSLSKPFKYLLIVAVLPVPAVPTNITFRPLLIKTSMRYFALFTIKSFRR